MFECGIFAVVVKNRNTQGQGCQTACGPEHPAHRFADSGHDGTFLWPQPSTRALEQAGSHNSITCPWCQASSYRVAGALAPLLSPSCSTFSCSQAPFTSLAAKYLGRNSSPGAPASSSTLKLVSTMATKNQGCLASYCQVSKTSHQVCWPQAIHPAHGTGPTWHIQLAGLHKFDTPAFDIPAVISCSATQHTHTQASAF